jgi:hypothetical protein
MFYHQEIVARYYKTILTLVKRTAMRKFHLLSAVLSLFLLVPASIIWAQTISSQKGLTTASFQTSVGNLKIYLPDDIRPGDMISGTISAEPSGKNEKQTAKNLAGLINYKLRIDGTEHPITAKPENFKWLLRNDNQESFPITLLQPGGSLVELRCKLNSLDSSIQSTSPGCSIPSHVLASNPLRVRGTFDGDAVNTKCMLGNKTLQVLTESPRQMCAPVSIDLTDPGGARAVFILEKNILVCTDSISVVTMEVNTGKLNLRKDETTFIDIKINGLDELPGIATLTITNLTPAVVKITEGDLQVIPIEHLAPGAKGVFSIHNTAKSTRAGTFSVNIDLELPEGVSPVQFEVKELDEPRRLEDEAIQIGLHQALKKIIADAGGAAGKEWDEVCDNCKGCIESRLGEWAPKLVEKLGKDILKHFASKMADLIGGMVKGVGAAKEFFDKISDKTDKAEELAKELEEKIKSGDLQAVELKPVFCVKNSYCLISGTIFYNPKTGCVLAIMKCEGTKLCCPQASTQVVISYCTDEKGMPKDKPQITVIHG